MILKSKFQPIGEPGRFPSDSDTSNLTEVSFSLAPCRVRMTIDAEAANLMAQGKRHLLVHDYTLAVQCLEEAAKLYDQKYGTGADECADAYLRYGYALLELHRQESGALDGIVEKQEGSENEEDEEADEEIEEEEELGETKPEGELKDETNGAAKEEDISVSPTPADTEVGTNGSLANAAAEISNGNASTAAGPSGAEQQLAASSSTSGQMETDVDPNQPSTSTGITDENRAEEEEDAAPSNIEVAFEVLSMARDIYKRQVEYRDDANLKLSEALQKLGEILIEWENNTDALVKLTECLKIRQRHLPDDDRLIAEVYYHIGLAYSLNNNVHEANENFQKAIDVIEMRLSKLKGSYSAEPDATKKAKIEQEVSELEMVLPDMKGRIEEVPVSAAPFGQASQPDERPSLKEFMEKELSSEVVDEEKRKQMATKPIMNVTHLVKRKREETEDAESSKKLKNGSNGHAAENVEMKEQ